MTMNEIEKKAARFSTSRQCLSEVVAQLNAAIEDLKRQYLPAIKKYVARAAEDQSELRAAIEASPELFEQPRTQIFHGIKVGYRKGSGKIEWVDDERVAELIKKHLPDQYDVLVKTTHKPQVKAMKQLEVGDLKRVGCTVEETGDVVVIKATDSEVDKVVAALLKGAVDEAQEEEA